MKAKSIVNKPNFSAMAATTLLEVISKGGMDKYQAMRAAKVVEKHFPTPEAIKQKNKTIANSTKLKSFEESSKAALDKHRDIINNNHFWGSNTISFKIIQC